MGETELVEADIKAGLDFVKKLDQSGFDVVAAYWFYFSDSQRWRLTIVTQKASKGSRELYLKATEIDSELDLARVEFVPPTNAVYRGIAGAHHIVMPGLGTMRVSRSTFDGVYVEDAMFYRLNEVPA